MKRLLTLFGISLLLFVSFTNCSKDEDPTPPTMTLKSDQGYIASNTTAAYGDTLRFGVTANGNGSDNLVKFTIAVNDQVLLDSTINTQNFTFNFYTTKSVLDSEKWVMTVTDQAGNTANNTVTITGTFGAINSFTTVLLGAQDNVATESFLSLSNNEANRYFQAAAFDHQADIDMFCYYENTPEHVNLMTLASPGANVTGIFSGATSPEFYTTKNTTLFVKTELNPAMFDGVENDATLLAVYNADSTYKKAKMLAEGDVYSFKLQSGKYGIFKVVDVTGTETGSITLEIKVQQ